MARSATGYTIPRHLSGVAFKSHMQVLATTLLSVHNLLNTHFAGLLQLILATCF